MEFHKNLKLFSINYSLAMSSLMILLNFCESQKNEHEILYDLISVNILLDKGLRINNMISINNLEGVIKS